MAREDWKGILVPSEDCTEVYRRIFQELGIDDVVEVKTGGGPLVEAQRVGEVAKSSSKKPLVIGLGHHLMAYVGDNSVDYVYFDAHSDDNINGGNNPFSCATFINHMQGRHYVSGVGEGVYPKGSRARWFRHSEAEKIVEIPFRDNIFLTYDVDVFDPSVTTAHGWGLCWRMFPQQVKDLSGRIIDGRNLIGMNVASYKPYREAEQNYKTVDVIVDLLRPRL